jgi:hypothetical protein
MRFYTNQYKYYCGIDLHTRKMYVCILDEKGEIREHRNLKTDRDAFLKAVAPYREDIVVAVECIFTWYWVADLCHKEGIPFVLGHALYMKAIHGGKAKNDTIDSQKIAALLRGGMMPPGEQMHRDHGAPGQYYLLSHGRQGEIPGFSGYEFHRKTENRQSPRRQKQAKIDFLRVHQTLSPYFLSLYRSMRSLMPRSSAAFV